MFEASAKDGSTDPIRLELSSTERGVKAEATVHRRDWTEIHEVQYQITLQTDRESDPVIAHAEGRTLLTRDAKAARRAYVGFRETLAASFETGSVEVTLSCYFWNRDNGARVNRDLERRDFWDWNIHR